MQRRGFLRSTAFGKMYTRHNEAAIMMANLTGEAAHATFELDSRRYGVTAETYTTISSNGGSGAARANEEGALLKGTRSLDPYEVIAVLFERLHDPKDEKL